jgi:spore coat polysaccharide biosynthesis protein SpsF (cytidylyltransferase family)
MTEAEEKRLRDLANHGLTLGAELTKLQSATKALLDDPASEDRRHVCWELLNQPHPEQTEWVHAHVAQSHEARANDLEAHADQLVDSWASVSAKALEDRETFRIQNETSKALIDTLFSRVEEADEVIAAVKRYSGAGVGSKTDVGARLAKIFETVSAWQPK